MSETEKTTTPATETTPAPAPATTTEEKPKSIFGSSFTSTFTSFGQAPATNTTTSPTTSTTTQSEESTSTTNDSEANAPDHEPNVEFAPKLNLNKVEVKTNEEDEDVVFEMRAKLFRFVTDPQPQWNERGTGQVKLLKHKENGKIRIIMRREKVFKVCLNHYVSPILKLEVNAGNDKSWVWKCPKDFSDEDHPEGVEETFAIRFASAENAQAFKTSFESCQTEMKELLAKKE
ncbi:hypothetical protein SAMD00019534_050570 [Acytostelium subglobosum LB1]|uniref:hypothetical protein n=1 Tax=Acytostelium subglobosum LB1 TaxID=1410327 RepID=UPI0006450EFB|nr:hypothetical protein SAMD00019534_050570 [Acytostelium subglobosum LB1]GAM21882.1 hypothetical protein SAMD00019534_050570 [Acytostelium subglobosum LB1]|eukprot:XP_012754982.1 hypothetical protein SAMD00019534_050570 [Acytostelium subglobosum LB1]